MAGTSVADRLHRVEQIMGMPIEVDVRDADVDPETVAAAFDWFRQADRTFSTYKADSDLSRFNRGEVTLDEVDPHLRLVLERCEQLRFETQGYFDIQSSVSLAGMGDSVR